MDAEKRRAVLLVMAAVICDYIGVGMMRVTLPFYAEALGGGAALIGGVETAYGVGQVLGALVLPRLSDRIGRRPVLMLSFAGSAAGYALAIAARAAGSPWLLLASRLPVGLAKQTVTVSRAVVADCTASSGEARSLWMSWLGTAIGIGYSLGPFLGGQLAERVSDGMPAVVATAIFVLLLPVAALSLPETAPETVAVAAAASPHDTGPPLWRVKEVRIALSVLALPELGLVAHTSVTLYAFCLRSLGKGKAWLGNLTSMTAALQALLAGLLLPRLSSRGWSDGSLLHLGAWSFAIACAMIAAGGSGEAVLSSVAPAAVAIAVLRSYPAALLSKCVPQQRQGEAMGLLDLSSSALRVLAPVLAGLTMDRFGELSVFTGQAVLFLLSSAALTAALPRIGSSGHSGPAPATALHGKQE